MLRIMTVVGGPSLVAGAHGASLSPASLAPSERILVTLPLVPWDWKSEPETDDRKLEMDFVFMSDPPDFARPREGFCICIPWLPYAPGSAPYACMVQGSGHHMPAGGYGPVGGCIRRSAFCATSRAFSWYNAAFSCARAICSCNWAFFRLRAAFSCLSSSVLRAGGSASFAPEPMVTFRGSARLSADAWSTGDTSKPIGAKSLSSVSRSEAIGSQHRGHLVPGDEAGGVKKYVQKAGQEYFRH
mmetsp:Transcript_70874/g.196902  ORF Transcript_70874/g.196902 Transcript_70874/m.196902 type:complete len:243 (+) Transcript_70874:552-1280(+)